MEGKERLGEEKLRKTPMDICNVAVESCLVVTLIIVV
jgi:hypothetical protein